MIQKTIYAFLLAFSLAACGGNENNSNNNEGTTAGTGNDNTATGNTVEPTDEGTAANNNAAGGNTNTTAGDNNTAAANNNTPPGGNPAGAMAISKEDADKGLALINKSDCLGCHKVDQRLVGPSYQEVAEKYPATDANLDMLAGKVISGGSGNWGQIPMTPHPQISKDDARQMIKYVLSVKK